MPRTTPSSPEAASAEARRTAALRAAAEQNYTAQRVLRALEVILQRPSSAPTVASYIGVHERTARRILQTLTNEGYVERRGGRGRAAYDYLPTVRLLAMAAQLALQLPLVQGGRRAVCEIERRCELTAYVAVPCYCSVLVVASSGARALRSWATLPAHADAAGRVLLAHRRPWRESIMRLDANLTLDEGEAVAIITQGYDRQSSTGDQCGTLAVPVPTAATPVAALAVRGRSNTLNSEWRDLVRLLHRYAAEVAKAAETSASDSERSAHTTRLAAASWL
jgi:DNA-binding IclR family transcriptional regulator